MKYINSKLYPIIDSPRQAMRRHLEVSVTSCPPILIIMQPVKEIYHMQPAKQIYYATFKRDLLYATCKTDLLWNI